MNKTDAMALGGVLTAVVLVIFGIALCIHVYGSHWANPELMRNNHVPAANKPVSEGG